MEKLCTTVAVIEALGGNQAVADHLARGTDRPVSNKAVSNWRKFKKFPPRTYLAITSALQAIGKTAPASLWGMEIPAASPPLSPGDDEQAPAAASNIRKSISRGA